VYPLGPAEIHGSCCDESSSISYYVCIDVRSNAMLDIDSFSEVSLAALDTA